MSFLTKYGTLYGLLPEATGRIFWVAPSDSYVIDGRTFSASNDNDGLSPERAFRRINRAIDDKVAASQGDVVMLLEGTHTVTETVRIDTAGVTIWGVRSSNERMNRLRPRAIVTAVGESNEVFSIEANNVELGYMEIRGETNQSAVIFAGASPDGIYIHDVKFAVQNVTVDVDTYMLDFAYRSSTLDATGGSIAKQSNTTTLATAYVERCVFWTDGANGRAVDIATAQVYLKDCWFHNSAGAWATPVAVATAADHCVIDSCIWTTSGTMGVCIDGTTADLADSVHIINCRFPRTGVITSGLVVDNFGTNEAQLTESYQEGSATAVTAID